MASKIRRIDLNFERNGSKDLLVNHREIHSKTEFKVLMNPIWPYLMLP